MFGDEVRREASDVGGHFVDGEADGVHVALLLGLVLARLVVLRHRHDHVTLGAGRARDLHEKLRVHRRRFCAATASNFPIGKHKNN